MTRAATIAAWWTLHALLAVLLLQVALGDFAESTTSAKTFVFASMANALIYLKVPLHPAVAFGLLFAALTLCAWVIALLWRLLLRILAAKELDALAGHSLAWAVKRQLLSPWLLVPSLLMAATGLAWSLSSVWTVGAITLFCVFGLPALVLRPRWLGSSVEDRSWHPSAVALATYWLFTLGPWGLDAAATAMGLRIDALWFVSLLLGLEMWLAWLASSILMSVRHRRELGPHLRSRVQRRFASLVAVAIVKPWQIAVVWWLPPLLLLIGYQIFIAPTVTAVSAHLPAIAVALHQAIRLAGTTVSDYKFLMLVPALATVTNLYVGRCLVLLDRREGAKP